MSMYTTQEKKNWPSMFLVGQTFTTKHSPKRTAQVVLTGHDGNRARILMYDEADNLLADSWVDYRRFIHHWLPAPS